MQITDYTGLPDPQFMDERRHVREKLERLPERHADRAKLTVIYQAMTAELDRRARTEWQQWQQPTLPAGSKQGR